VCSSDLRIFSKKEKKSPAKMTKAGEASKKSPAKKVVKKMTKAGEASKKSPAKKKVVKKKVGRSGKFRENAKIYEETLNILEEDHPGIYKLYTSEDMCFRRMEKEKDPHYIHPNQLLTAKIIVLYWIMGKLGNGGYDKRAMLLIAEMQSGKTGTYASVIYIICANDWLRTLLGISNIVVFSGMNDKNLYEQMKTDLLNISSCRYLKEGDSDSESDSESDSDSDSELDTETLSDSCVIFNDDQDRLKIMKNSDVKSSIGQLNNTNTLYIHDESDFACSEGQKIGELFESIEINLNGLELEDKNNYLLSVSATPFADIHNNHIKNDRKELIHLETDDKYKSIESMQDGNKFKPSFEFLKYRGKDLLIFEEDLNIDDLKIEYSNADDEGKREINDKIKAANDVDNVFFLFTTTVTDTNQSMQQCFYSSTCLNQRN
jgi:hypothetical protein